MILAGRYLLNDLNLKQLNMITFTCGCLGLWLMIPRKKWPPQFCGGVLLAFSIGLKLFTLPLLIMLVIKGDWRRAAGVSLAAIGIIWLLPRAVLGSALYEELSAISNSATLNMWLQVKDTTQTWSFLNFVHYRIFVDPLWSGLDAMSPRAYQLICVLATVLIGLPTLRVLLRSRWRDENATRLWEEIAMVGVRLGVDRSGRPNSALCDARASVWSNCLPAAGSLARPPRTAALLPVDTVSDDWTDNTVARPTARTARASLVYAIRIILDRPVSSLRHDILRNSPRRAVRGRTGSGRTPNRISS